MTLKVMLVDEGHARSDLLAESLENESFKIVGRIRCESDLLAAIDNYLPDVLVIDMVSPDEEIFNQLVDVNEDCPRPVVFFAEQGETEIIQRAVKTGVGAFVVDGLSGRKMRPVIELSIARFREIQSLQYELQETKSKLAERKVIERAKGILMQSKNMTEDSSYKLLRKIAMEQNKKLVEVAKTTIEMAELFH